MVFRVRVRVGVCVRVCVGVCVGVRGGAMQARGQLGESCEGDLREGGSILD